MRKRNTARDWILLAVHEVGKARDQILLAIHEEDTARHRFGFFWQFMKRIQHTIGSDSSGSS
jgi:hypothetical protein